MIHSQGDSKSLENSDCLYSFLWPEAVGKGAVRSLLLFVELLSQWFCIIYYDGVNVFLLDMYNLNPASSCVTGYD